MRKISKRLKSKEGDWIKRIVHHEKGLTFFSPKENMSKIIRARKRKIFIRRYLGAFLTGLMVILLFVVISVLLYLL